MKNFYSIISLILITHCSYSQSCLPDSLYRDSTAGVYPKPKLGGSGTGIDKIACINKPYEFVFTVVIPDTLTIPGIPIVLNLTHAKIETTGAISNLPKGISYACNPPTCVFPRKTMGCLVLKGTPDKTNLPGEYKPIIKLEIGTLLGAIVIDYPGAQFPGEYVITLLDENCLIATKDINIVKDNFFPNPSDGWINSREDNISDLRLTDALGKTISIQSQTTDSKFILNDDLVDGFYLLSWKSAQKLYVQKILLRRNY